MFQTACFLGWNGFALFVARLTVVAAGSAVVSLSARQLWRVFKGTDRGVIPAALWAFVFGWSSVLLSIATFLWVTCGRLRYDVVTSLYVVSVGWTILGLSVILWHGIREYDRAAANVARLQESVIPKVDCTKTKG